MASLTLAQYATNPKPLVAGVAKILQEESMFMNVLPFEDVGALSVQVIREGSLPNISWRRPGNAHGSSKGTDPDRVVEQAFSFGNTVDIDRVYLKDNAPRLYDPRTYWTDQTVKALAREFNDAAINGDPVSNPDRPTGLFKRMSQLPAAQRISAAADGGNGGLDISPDAANLSANIQTLFDRLDQLIYATADHKADYILCNDTFIMRYWSIARQSGLLKTTTDNIGREMYEYKGAKLIDMGFKLDDSTRIIGNAETTNGNALTGGTATSLYAIRVGAEYFTGWQEYGMTVEDIGWLDDGVTYRLLIDWVVGLALSNPRSVTRLFGVIAA